MQRKLDVKLDAGCEEEKAGRKKKKKSWTSKNFDPNGQLSHAPLNSQTSSVNPNLLPMT